MNEKLIRLVIIYKRFQFPHKTEIIYKEEEFEYASEMAESYNLDSLVCMNRFLTYSMKINDDVYKQVFMECIDEIVSAIEILCPQRDEVPNEYRGNSVCYVCVYVLYYDTAHRKYDWNREAESKGNSMGDGKERFDSFG